MKKIIEVDGMQCAHCQNSVETALRAVEGVVSAKVDLKKKIATVVGNADDQALVAAVEKAGFQPGMITEKKGLFEK